jgi:hypothetical protein
LWFILLFLSFYLIALMFLTLILLVDIILYPSASKSPYVSTKSFSGKTECSAALTVNVLRVLTVCRSVKLFYVVLLRI